MNTGIEEIISAFEAGWLAACPAGESKIQPVPDHLIGFWQDGYAAALAEREDQASDRNRLLH